jgi:hypothetical protein
MRTVQTHTIHTCSYLCSYTTALTQYAESNKDFAEWLHTQLPDLGRYTQDVPASEVVPGLVPRDEQAAARRAVWLLGEVATAPQEEREHVYALLSQWSRSRAYESPKAVVLGIKVGVLPIGVMGKMGRKHEPMAVIVDRTKRERLGTPAMLRTLTSLTNGVVELGLHKAAGQTAHLEPELGDWLFGEKTVTLYTAPKASLEAIERELSEAGAPVATEKTEQGSIVALAMTPAVYAGDLTVAETLEQISLE